MLMCIRGPQLGGCGSDIGGRKFIVLSSPLDPGRPIQGGSDRNIGSYGD